MNSADQIIINKKPVQMMGLVESDAPFAYASFSKSSSLYAAVSTPSINDNSLLSFGGWFRLRETSSAGPLTVCGWSLTGSWGSTHIQRNSYRLGTGSQSSNFSIPSLEMNTWLHLAVSYDGESVKFYKNGQVIHSVLFSTPRINNEALFRLSSFNEGSLKYSSVDASRVFVVSKGLSQEEVMQLMNAKKLTTKIPCLTEESLVNAWNIDEGAGTVFASISMSKAPMTANSCTWGVEEE